MNNQSKITVLRFDKDAFKYGSSEWLCLMALEQTTQLGELVSIEVLAQRNNKSLRYFENFLPLLAYAGMVRIEDDSLSYALITEKAA